MRLLAVGDVGLGWRPIDDPFVLFRDVVPLLSTADTAFCQVEALPTDLGEMQVHTQVKEENIRGHPEHPKVLVRAGFTVVSFATNHALDLGHAAFLDAIANLRASGLAVIGAGKDLEDARRHVIRENAGIRVAFLGYCSILNEGFAARADKPGVAPMRAHTFYEPLEFQPGSPARVRTAADANDLDALVSDIAAARRSADHVVVSMHWGVHYAEKTVIDYQREIAHLAIDAGAAMVLGHHPHLLHGIEFYRGRPIFYSIGNFAMIMGSPSGLRHIYPFETDPEYDSYQFPVASKRSVAVSATFSRQSLERLAMLPIYIEKDAHPVVLKRGDTRFDEVLSYIRWVSDGFSSAFSVSGDEIVPTAA